MFCLWLFFVLLITLHVQPAIPKEFRQLSKGAFKKNCRDFLLSMMEAENDYVEVPILLQKMANSASSTQCTNNR